MEIKMKDKLLLNGRFGAIRKIEALYQRISNKFYVKRGASLRDLEPMHYEFTQQCKADALEFELRKAQAMAEAQRNLRMI